MLLINKKTRTVTHVRNISFSDTELHEVVAVIETSDIWPMEVTIKPEVSGSYLFSLLNKFYDPSTQAKNPVHSFVIEDDTYCLVIN